MQTEELKQGRPGNEASKSPFVTLFEQEWCYEHAEYLPQSILADCLYKDCSVFFKVIICKQSLYLQKVSKFLEFQE